MKIVSFALCGPGEAGRLLEKTLHQFGWVDAICVCLNNVGVDERKIVEKYADFIIEDNRTWGLEQWRIKQDFLAKVAAEVKPDWIICHDMDEIFDPRFDRAMAEKMASGHDVAWYFWAMQLWNDPGQVRMDLSFPNIRFYKLMPDLGLHFQAQALHCGLAPRYAYRFGSQSGLWFKHYGLMSQQDRARKVARYDLYDPKAVYKGKSWYDGLRNERARSVPFAEALTRLPEFIYRKKPLSPNSMSRKEQKLFLFTNKHGKVVEAVGEKQRDQFIKAGFQPREELHTNAAPEAPVVAAGTTANAGTAGEDKAPDDTAPVVKKAKKTSKAKK